MSQPQNTALTERIEGRIDQDVMGELAIGGAGARTPTFASMRDVLEFAKVMAVSGIAVRAHLRNNPGVCAAVTMQAQRWEMDPFTVGNKSYVVNDQLAFEAQLITAVVNTRAPIKGRLKTRFEGQGLSRKCIAWATFVGEDEPTEVESPTFGAITPKNSPLWKSDPDQQLAYYTKRLWARRECPEVLLGVYDVDELAPQPRGPETARDVTPPRPQRADFREAGQGALVHPGITDTADDGPSYDEDGVVTEPGASAADGSPNLTVAMKALRSGAPDWKAFQDDITALLRAHPDRAQEIEAANQAALDDLAKEDVVRRATIRQRFVDAATGEVAA